ncbi:hypothetical protein HaLaN_28608 [Haematococcus lacustris]|uniref:Uncharacterized protein n=1 Tax=Haematococcus lacustris TaxID=44745 RepID=A0A6A0ADE3_HAELA|nr:hypothetical protein HaLaN_28608 [Haematococcus lacustris]
MPASPFSGCCWPKRGKASVLSKQVLPPDPVCRQEEQGPGADAVPRPNPANLAQVLAQVPAISAYEQLRECCSLISGYGDLDYAW